MRSVKALAAAALLLLPACDIASAADQPKQGGIFRVYHRDSPGSASIHEGATYSVNIPFMPIFNNLVVFKQDVPQNSVDSIVPDLAESWAWSPDNKKLTFKLRQGVKWHDGKPFTAKDVQCTWRMLIGKGDAAAEFRRNPRAVWWSHVQDVSINGDYEATFELNQPQPSLLVLLASLFSPVYACHVPQSTMRTRPIGTGPFKFAEFKRGDSIRLTRNPDYFKKDRPYLDEITFKIIESQATRLLAFQAGEFDITFPSDVHVPLFKDMKERAPKAV